MDFVMAAKANIKEVSADELEAMINDKQDLVVVDVREPGEFMHGHVKQALLVPRGVLEPAADLDYPKKHEVLSAARNRPVALYCATGGRSALAANVLQEMGFEEVYSLAGGFDGWTQAGKPIFKEGEY
jgi:rhodanese-related sulfurtransferase